jgi:hypothetical protein
VSGAVGRSGSRHLGDVLGVLTAGVGSGTVEITAEAPIGAVVHIGVRGYPVREEPSSL